MVLIRKVECIRLYMTDIKAGLAFYRNQLGHSLIWRNPLVLLDTSRGFLKTDIDGNVMGNQES